MYALHKKSLDAHLRDQKPSSSSSKRTTLTGRRYKTMVRLLDTTIAVLLLVTLVVGQEEFFLRKLIRSRFNRRIRNSYIVVLNDDVPSVRRKVFSLLRAAPFQEVFLLEASVKGFVVSGLAGRFLMRILQDSDVAFVEEVSVFQATNGGTTRGDNLLLRFLSFLL